MLSNVIHATWSSVLSTLNTLTMSSEPGDLDFSLASLFDVRDKIALVTDGGSRAGAAIATALLQNGAKVYVVCESEEISLSVKELLNDKGQCECIVSDLKSKVGCVSLCDTFKQLEDHLNILVNNSGATWGGNWEEFPDEVTGCLTGLLTKDATVSDPGRIINVPVVVLDDAVDSSEEHLSLSYDANKSAVSHLTTVLSISLASKFVSVNAILPDIEMAQISNPAGDTISEAFVPTERVESARDLAGILMFLVSSGGARITGARIEAERLGLGTTNRWWGRKRPSVDGI
ncbi:hypothetical protein FRC12_011098 [Ceratobasidium sp. 428]|nr:hypothetical protein FRC12_011098 [Ceratobasidium sp. 428]